jgi:hypothetical protein
MRPGGEPPDDPRRPPLRRSRVQAVTALKAASEITKGTGR